MRTLVLVAALALAAAGCGGTGETAPTAERPAPAVPETRDGPDEPAETSDPAPGDGISGETLDGERLSLDAFRGRYLFVNVWSSW